MREVFLNDFRIALKQKAMYAMLLILAVLGLLTGLKFHMSVGDGLAVNAPYSLGFMIGLLSLVNIFIATFLAFLLLFKEKDADFSLIVFTTPILSRAFALARFGSFYMITLGMFLVMVVGYVVGIHIQSDTTLNDGFHLWHYLYAFLVFGVVNALVVCSLLFFLAQKFQNKLLVAISGMLLYVLYMIALMFSNAPFMAQALPQSELAQRISAAIDLFGLSGYFFEASGMSLSEKSINVVPFANFLLVNRLGFITLSMGMVLLGVRAFSVNPRPGKKSKMVNFPSNPIPGHAPIVLTSPKSGLKARWEAICSFAKIDLIYVFKSIALIAVSVLLLFYMGIEMFDDIDVGIRLPQHYASSGLLAETINNSFFYLGAMVMVYFVNDIYWRSAESGFSMVEKSMPYSIMKRYGHCVSIIALVCFLSFIQLAEAIIFQLAFGYMIFDWQAYLGVIVFNTLPMILLALYLLELNVVSKSKSVALGVSILFFLLFVTPISRMILKLSVLRFLSGYKGAYSEFFGYGSYMSLFLWRLCFGFAVLLALVLLIQLIRSGRKWQLKSVGLVGCVAVVLFAGTTYLDEYVHKNEDAEQAIRADYERRFRKYQYKPQPGITEVKARVNLFPESQAYDIHGVYSLVNTSLEPIDSMLINLPDGFDLDKLIYEDAHTRVLVDRDELILEQPLKPQDSARLTFTLSYKWSAVNGHDPFNAIVENGSFMRLSRYFPTFGYDEDAELVDDIVRAQYGLGAPTSIKSLDAPKVRIDDSMDLELDISTTADQIAIGTGELIKEWSEAGRKNYRYVAKDIPFRFAVSSARYMRKQVSHRGIGIHVLFHPLHAHNVNYLIENAKLTLDYCIEQFGPYPFQSVVFAEVSSFTSGFAGTAYPGVIFVTEDMTFNAHLGNDASQDVVNELAGHEVAHFWWGTSGISPDYREGHALMTEGLAMYTEMMIFKEMYGREKMLEKVAMHRQIYEAEKGYTTPNSLVKATSSESHIVYSKAAMVFVELSELMSEQALNRALRNFFVKHKYPFDRPVAIDLLGEILDQAKEVDHERIRLLFESRE